MKLNKARTWAEIDLENIKHNVRAIKAALPSGCRFLGVVKADAYGHGALPVAKAILDAGGEYLAVACVSEALYLRRCGIEAPILVLGITPAGYAPELAKHDITQAVASLDYAEALSAELTEPLRCHLKINSGMGRIGFSWREESFGDIEKALSLPNMDYEGIFTHFAVSDEPEKDFTKTQFERFMTCVKKAEAGLGRRFALRHCANSGAVINFREYALDMVRPGIMTYGMYPAAQRGGIELRPAMSLRSRVYAINRLQPGDTVSYGRTYTAERELLTAVIPIGYADGLSRSLSGNMDVIIRGQRCPQIGRICMDMCMVDISGLPECEVGDTVTVIGTDGAETILADELAERQGSINYEVTCDVAPRVPRIYSFEK